MLHGYSAMAASQAGEQKNIMSRGEAEQTIGRLWKTSSPRLLRRHLLRSVIFRLLGAEAFLVGLLLLADLFTSIWRLSAAEASFAGILRWLLSGLPSYAVELLPVAYLFAITLCLAEMHADGELMVIWGSGISVHSLSRSVLFFSLFLSVSVFFAKDQIAIPALLAKDRLYSELTTQAGRSLLSSNITIMDDAGAMVYKVGRFDPNAQQLLDVDIVGRDKEGLPWFRLTAPSAQWRQEGWFFTKAKVYSTDKEGRWTVSQESRYTNPLLKAEPADFGLIREKPEHMKGSELSTYIKSLEASGLPTVEARTELHKRYSFLLTPLIVYGLSLSFAGLFRKNSLLMSLLFSLSAATVYYVAQMLGSLASKTGWVSPEIGIWTISLVFSLIAALGFLRARS
jgi:lipopolysaccharide export LptBFGC system permease protein LptF